MFRLIKLAIFVGIGYALFELIQGFLAERSGAAAPSGKASPAAPQKLDPGYRPGVGTMTGPGKGQRVKTEEISGAGGTHVVGRGVI